MRTLALALIIVMASITITDAVEQSHLELKFDSPALLEKSIIEKVPNLGLYSLLPLSTSEYLLVRGYGRSAPRSYKGGGQLELRSPYLRKDGKIVSPHLRTKPDNNLFNNLKPPKQPQIDKRLYEGRSPFGP